MSDPNAVSTGSFGNGVTRREFEALTHLIEETDTRLRAHIGEQMSQIKAALESAERLEKERISSLREQTNTVVQASAEAIKKAEAATERRFEAVNEFRAQLAAQAAQFMPRETAEARLASAQELTEARAASNAQKIDDLATRMDKMTGSEEGGKAAVGYLLGVGGLAIGVVFFIISFVANH